LVVIKERLILVGSEQGEIYLSCSEQGETYLSR
jgi:hypothetical protein